MLEIITTYANTIMAWYGGIVACATIIVKLTPTPKDDSVLETIVNFIDNFSTVNTKKNQEKLDK
jgi:hypothetical protein